MSNTVIYCCWCGNQTTLDEAMHAEGLEGNFCGEGCIFACLRQYWYIVPFPTQTQMQMGENENVPKQIDDCATEKRPDADWQ